MENLDFVLLGSFMLPTGHIIVSDPSYEKGAWCMGELECAYSGRWHALASYTNLLTFEARISSIVVKSDDCPPRNILIPTVESFAVEVVSGIVGFFDSRHFQAGNSMLCRQWYEYCKRHIKPPHNAGIITCGIVASAGYDDGEHRCISYRDEKNVIHMAELILIEESAHI